MLSNGGDNYLVLDGVLLLYTGAPLERIVIPAVIGNQKITRIGSGAFRNWPALKSITIPDTVTSIESFAFADCNHLEEVALSVLSDKLQIANDAFAGCKNIQRILTSVTELQYKDNNEWGYKLEDESVVMLNIANIKTVLGSVGDYIERLPLDTKYIFSVSINNANPTKERLLVYGLKDRISIDEDEAFLNHINKGLTSDVSIENETMIDWYARANKTATYSHTILTYYYPEETMKLGGKVHIKFYVSEGYHFVQSAAKVVLKGMDYYVYRRHYITATDKEPLMRRDMNVYNSKGVVTDKELTKEIYAKYRLLALL